jgi:hypothetical protein
MVSQLYLMFLLWFSYVLLRQRRRQDEQHAAHLLRALITVQVINLRERLLPVLKHHHPAASTESMPSLRSPCPIAGPVGATDKKIMKGSEKFWAI